jgi:hypothetical protein
MASENVLNAKRKRTDDFPEGESGEQVDYSYFPFSLLSVAEPLADTCDKLLTLSDRELPAQVVKILADMKHSVFVNFDAVTTTKYYIPPFNLSRGSVNEQGCITKVGTLTNNLVDIGYYEGVVDAFGIGLSKYYDTECP